MTTSTYQEYLKARQEYLRELFFRIFELDNPPKARSLEEVLEQENRAEIRHDINLLECSLHEGVELGLLEKVGDKYYATPKLASDVISDRQAKLATASNQVARANLFQMRINHQPLRAIGK